MATTSSAVTDTNPYSFLNGDSGAATAKKSSIEEAQDRFMKLLVAQLQTQDPLNPLDNAAVTSQMAQISTVQGIEKLNQSMSSLNDMYKSSQSVSAAALIGRIALASGSQTVLSSGKAVAGVSLAKDAEQVVINVNDATGKTVYTETLKDQKAGVLQFQWDGKDKNGNAQADGNYSISVSAKQGDTAVEASPLTYSVIQAISWEANGSPSLHLANGKQTTVDAIRQLI
jgi:flagellar basal-body rod modification protein FlgD